MDWIGLAIGIAIFALIVGVREMDLRKRRRKRRLEWDCPWCGEIFSSIPDYIDHKDQHLKDEIEKRG